MKATRNGDTLRLELTGKEIVDHIDFTAMWDTVCSQLAREEVLGDWTLPVNQTIILNIQMEIIALLGESDRDIYRKENGVPFV